MLYTVIMLRFFGSHESICKFVDRMSTEDLPDYVLDTGLYQQENYPGDYYCQIEINEQLDDDDISQMNELFSRLAFDLNLCYFCYRFDYGNENAVLCQDVRNHIVEQPIFMIVPTGITNKLYKLTSLERLESKSYENTTVGVLVDDAMTHADEMFELAYGLNYPVIRAAHNNRTVLH